MSIKTGKREKVSLSSAIDFFAPISRRVLVNLLIVKRFSFTELVATPQQTGPADGAIARRACNA